MLDRVVLTLTEGKMPTPPTDNVLHALSGMGGSRDEATDETSLLRRLAQRQDAEIKRLTAELAATEQQRDEWMRAAMLCECERKTAVGDYEALSKERDERVAAFWPGRD